MITVDADCFICGPDIEAKLLDCDACREAADDLEHYDPILRCSHYACTNCGQPL